MSVGMDNNDRRQRHTIPGQAQHPVAPQAQAQYSVESASERFRQAPQPAAAQLPTSAPQVSRMGSQTYYSYQPNAYPQYANPAVQTPQGAPEYASEQPQRAYQYGQSVMYNVPGAHAPAGGQSQYEPVQPYQQGRESAIEVLNSGFGSVPQASAQYYMPSQEGPAATAATAMATQSVPSQYPSLPYTGQQAQVEREQLSAPYSTPDMPEPHQSTAQESYSHAQSNYRESTTAAGEHEEFYNTFDNLLKRTNDHTAHGRMRDASETLMQLSDWFFRWVEPLGLARDDEDQAPTRLELWNNFNTCWLAALQKQKELMQAIVNAGQRPQPSQSLMDEATLERMANFIIENANKLERYGLVDYQMGVAEEEIIAMITACCDLWDEVNDGSGTSQQPGPQPAARRRP